MSDSNLEPGEIRLRSRTIGTIDADDETVIVVEHVYAPEGVTSCTDCGGASHDPGMVGVVVLREGLDPVSMLITAEDALALSNRLQRAVSLVHESQEDPADIEREAARYAPAAGAGDA